MKLPLYILDAFADHLFGGNPAAVCPLERWLPDALMQAIAAENNLAETAFFVGAEGRYQLRWFTPTVEVDLCGHATLATAAAIFQHQAPATDELVFDTRSGPLRVTRAGDQLTMDFPAQIAKPCAAPAGLADCFNRAPSEVLAAADWLLVYPSQDDIEQLVPDFSALQLLPLRGVIATAPGREADFVSRFFGPKVGINEDPVTGSAHCTLAPYWSARLGRTQLTGRQLSARGGRVHCDLRGERVLLGGRCVPYLSGQIDIPDQS